MKKEPGFGTEQSSEDEIRQFLYPFQSILASEAMTSCLNNSDCSEAKSRPAADYKLGSPKKEEGVSTNFSINSLFKDDLSFFFLCFESYIYFHHSEVSKSKSAS